KENLESMV
nr:Chain B, Glutaminase L peptide [synthetic construct]